ncbi:MAG: LysR family transcriptional regulator [Nocardioides sp.]|uniref:LysR family transcriptional regulator n=1 Tax=Nocardioides sp. TaxID=35761 RepID=UPI0039E48AFC
MRIEQLEYVAAVTEHGSLRRAAEQLHVSQPALSEAIAKLERELRVTLLDRRRSGARISEAGRDLLPHMVAVLEAVDRLRDASGDRLSVGRNVRVGTVNAGTAMLLLPAIEAFQSERPGASVDVRNLQQDEIQVGLAEGTLDLGLVNLLDGDDVPPDLVGLELRRGRPVVVLPAGHRLAFQDEIAAADLREERFVGMRAGYVMHRFAHRLFGADLPRAWHSTDGAEMGKMMVAEGLGVTVLPDYSVVGDPLERSGLLVVRPIAEDATVVRMTLQQRRGQRTTEAVRAFIETLRRSASEESRHAVPR